MSNLIKKKVLKKKILKLNIFSKKVKKKNGKFTTYCEHHIKLHKNTVNLIVMKISKAYDINIFASLLQEYNNFISVILCDSAN